MTKAFFVFLFSFLVVSTSLASEQCTTILPTDATTNLIGYLGSMVEQGVVKIDDLQSFKKSLDAGHLVNPISDERASQDPVAELHRQGFETLLKEQIDMPQLAAWLSVRLEEEVLNRQSRGLVRDSTELAATKLTFAKLEKGDFWFTTGSDFRALEARKMALAGASDEEITQELGSTILSRRINLAQDFEVSSTTITQQIWLEVMGSLPSRIPLGENPITVQSEGSELIYNPDLPITNITFWSMLVFANKLSEFLGLKPVYNIEFDKFAGDPAKGTLVSLKKYRGLRKPLISINAEDGDYYKAEGFRLPTLFETEYIGRYNQEEYMGHHFGYAELAEDDKPVELEKYAWFDQQIMPVGLKLPLVIDDKNLIFDYHGNIGEAQFTWGNDVFSWGQNMSQNSPVNPQSSLGLMLFREKKTYLTTPLNLKGNSVRHVIGGTTKFFFDDASQDIGFRLVRSLP